MDYRLKALGFDEGTSELESIYMLSEAIKNPEMVWSPHGDYALFSMEKSAKSAKFWLYREFDRKSRNYKILSCNIGFSTYTKKIAKPVFLDSWEYLHENQFSGMCKFVLDYRKRKISFIADVPDAGRYADFECGEFSCSLSGFGKNVKIYDGGDEKNICGMTVSESCERLIGGYSQPYMHIRAYLDNIETAVNKFTGNKYYIACMIYDELRISAVIPKGEIKIEDVGNMIEGDFLLCANLDSAPTRCYNKTEIEDIFYKRIHKTEGSPRVVDVHRDSLLSPNVFNERFIPMLSRLRNLADDYIIVGFTKARRSDGMLFIQADLQPNGYIVEVSVAREGLTYLYSCKGLSLEAASEYFYQALVEGVCPDVSDWEDVSFYISDREYKDKKVLIVYDKSCAPWTEKIAAVLGERSGADVYGCGDNDEPFTDDYENIILFFGVERSAAPIDIMNYITRNDLNGKKLAFICLYGFSCKAYIDYLIGRLGTKGAIFLGHTYFSTAESADEWKNTIREALTYDNIQRVEADLRIILRSGESL